MSKKQDHFYYNNFIACTEYASQAAKLLQEILTNFRPEEISGRLEEIHEIERQADERKHELTDKLARAFITPIEREDIVELSHHIDEVTDKVEDVLLRVYINNVQVIRPEALELLAVVCKCCREVENLLKEFADFRHSGQLKEKIIRINTLEEEADQLYISSMHTLHTKETEVLTILAWREIYDYLEKCADACEHVADIVGSIVMKNS